MSSSSHFFVVGTVAVSFTIPKSLDKDDVDALKEDPGYIGAYSLEFSASPDEDYALQALPLYPKFFQGTGSGRCENNLVEVEFNGCFRIPVNPAEKGCSLFEAMIKDRGHPFVVKVMWGNTICPLMSPDGKKITSLLQAQSVIDSKNPKGIKFPR